MAPRRAARGKKDQKNATKIKKEKLAILLLQLDEFVNTRIQEIKAETEGICNQIRENYALALKEIPKEYHSMTLQQIDALQKKTPCKIVCSETKNPIVSASSSSAGPSAVSAFMSKLKSMHEQRTASSRKKQPISITSIVTGKNNRSAYPLKSNASNTCPGANMQNHRTLAVLAEQTNSSSYRKACATPVIKRKAFGQAMKRQLKAGPVTPKFDPRTPVPARYLRKPKVGETIMSLSGSPLQNVVTSEADSKKPALLLTLGDGKILNIAETNDLDSLTLDQKTKDTIIDVQKKLAGILKL